MKPDNIRMDLQHFDGGAAGAAGGSGGAAGGTGGTAPAGGQPGTAGQGAAPDEAAANERREKWKTVKGEYKDIYGEEVKAQVDDRLKKYKPMEAEHKALTERLARLQELAGVEDIDSLEASLTEAQKKRLEEAAYDNGMTVDEYMKAEQEKKDAEAYRKLQQKDQFIQRMTMKWQTEGTELQKAYPDFNLQAAMATNPMFQDLLRTGATVKAAYETAFAGQILSKNPKFEGFDFSTWTPDKAFASLIENGFSMDNAFEATNLDWTKQRTAQEMERRVADTIRSGKGRIPEAGAHLNPGAGKPNNLAGTDSKTRAQIMEGIRTGKLKAEDYGLG